MTNPEHSPFQPEAVERQQPTPFELATEFTDICENFSSITDLQEADVQRQRLLDLATKYAKGTEFIPRGLERDLSRFGNEAGKIGMHILADAVKINLNNEEFGIFSDEGAKKYEKSFLLVKLPKERQSMYGFPIPNQDQDIELRQAWAKEFESYYGEPVEPQETTVFIRPSTWYGKSKASRSY